jgi:hypothetical protein
MFSTEELLKLWTNDTARREFINNFKVWGVWFTQPELDLTFYKYDLPGGGKIIAMEYLREPYSSERRDGSDESVTRYKLYLQQGEHFEPSASSDGFIAERLKELKSNLAKEQKQRDRHCEKCGSKCLWYKPDGAVVCTVCMAQVA